MKAGLTKQIVYIDMDDTLCNYTGSFRASLRKNPGIAYPQSRYGFFANLEPIPGAIEAVQMLHASENYFPYILTAPSVPNPLSYSEKRQWIERHLGYQFCKQLILCPNKGLMRGEYLIDDNYAGKGQELFQGELIRFGSVEYPDWAAVLRKLAI